jgi:hypothetical protein
MKRAVIEFADQLDAAEVEAPAPSHVELQTFVIERIARVAIFQHPPSRIVWRNIAVGTSPRLQFYPAIKPAVWDKLGSPIVFKVHVVAGDARTVVFEETLSPSERASDRKWSQRSVDLSSWSNQTIDLELSTTSPTGGGVAFGWSGWGDLRLEHTTPTSNVSARRPRAARTPNLLLVTCDAMRRDHLGCYGATRTSTPNIDRLAREGLLFEHARAQTEATFGSYCSLLTGIHPIRTGVYAEWGRLSENLPTLPRHLAGAGYRTILAASERELANRRAGFRNAFAETIPVLGNPVQPSSITVRRLLRHLAQRCEEPWFVWMHLFEPHPPLMPALSALQRKYSADPTRPDRRDRVDLISRIRAVESCWDFENSPIDRSSGRLPTRILIRLRETLTALRDPSYLGPDLAAHIEGLGDRVRGGRTRHEFLAWLDAALTKAEQGLLTPDFLDWLDDLQGHLHLIEFDLLGWIDGVVDFRYPEALYAATIECVDAAIAELRNGLEGLKMLDDTVVVLTAPHGEYLGESPATILHHHVPGEISLRVPLIVRLPASCRIEGGQSVADVFSLVDLFPSLTEWLGLQPPVGTDGRSRAAEIAAGRRWTNDPNIAIGMRGAFVSVYRSPYKLVAALFPDVDWPWSSSHRPSDGIYLFHEDDESRDVGEANSMIRAELMDAGRSVISTLSSRQHLWRNP